MSDKITENNREDLNSADARKAARALVSAANTMTPASDDQIRKVLSKHDLLPSDVTLFFQWMDGLPARGEAAIRAVVGQDKTVAAALAQEVAPILVQDGKDRPQTLWPNLLAAYGDFQATLLAVIAAADPEQAAQIINNEERHPIRALITTLRLNEDTRRVKSRARGR